MSSSAQRTALAFYQLRLCIYVRKDELMAIMMMTAMAMSLVARDGFISGQTGQASNYLSDVPGLQPQTQREALTRGSLAGKGKHFRFLRTVSKALEGCTQHARR